MPDETKIFTRNHTLTDAELIRQLTERFQQDPTSPTTRALKERVGSILETSGGENLASEESVPYSPFPSEIDVTTLPGFMQDSYITWQQLSPEVQKKVSYYEKHGEWFVNIDGTKISMKNESAESSPSEGVSVVGGNTYFSKPAAHKHAKSTGRLIPTNDLWTKMAEFLGGLKNLKNILQIPLHGWIHITFGHQGMNKYAVVWTASNIDDFLGFHDDGYRIDLSDGLAFGRNLRLLDK